MDNKLEKRFVKIKIIAEEWSQINLKSAFV